MAIEKILLVVVLLFFCLNVGRSASAETRSFQVQFAGCTGFAGAATGQAAIVVRATSCQGVSVGQSTASEELPAYFLFGSEPDPPPNSQQTFLANWWFTGDAGKMKQSTSFPVISFGTAAVTLYTGNTSLLGNLIDGNTDSNFPMLGVRGVYFAATMTVTSTRFGSK